MADPALLLIQGDSSLPGLSALSTAGGVAPGLAQGESGAQGQFSGLLQARLQGQGGQAPPGVAGAKKALPTDPLLQNPGDISPLDGKALPLALLDETQFLLPGISELELLSELPTVPVLTDAVMTGIPLDAEGEPVLLAGTVNPVTNGLLGSTLANISNTEPAAANASMQTKDPLRPLPGVIPQPLPGQGVGQDRNPATPLSPLNTVLAEKENIAQQVAQVSSMTKRPLSLNQRLSLERARSSVMATASVSSGQGDKSLSQDLLSMAGLQTRNTIQAAAAQAGIASLQNQPKLLADKLVTSTITAPFGEENTYSSVLSSVQPSTGSVTANSMPTLNVATPVGQQGWASEMGQRVSWMANTKLHEAQLQLHPRHLGPLEVRITFGQEQQLNVNFAVSNPAAREAVDAALPRLREMFEQQGMNLQDANVSEESFAEQQRRRNTETAEDGKFTHHDDEDLLSTSPLDSLPPPLISGEGLIDAYA